MKLAILALGAALALGGCTTANTTGIDDFITTMSKTNCHVVISTAASVGAMNPGSGIQFQAQADCPNNGASTTQTTTVSKPTAAPPVDTLLSAPTTNSAAP